MGKPLQCVTSPPRKLSVALCRLWKGARTSRGCTGPPAPGPVSSSALPLTAFHVPTLPQRRLLKPRFAPTPTTRMGVTNRASRPMPALTTAPVFLQPENRLLCLNATSPGKPSWTVAMETEPALPMLCMCFCYIIVTPVT